MRILAIIFAAAYVALIVTPPIAFGPLTLPSDLYEPLLNTMIASTASTLVSLPLSLFLAFYAVRRGVGAIIPMTTFSTAIPHTALGLLLLPLFNTFGVVDTFYAVIASMIIVSTPIGVGAFTSMFAGSQRGLDELLQSLGIDDLKIMRLHIMGAPRPVAAAVILMWLRAFSELGAFLIVAQRPITVGIYLFELFLRRGPSEAVPMAMLLALTGFVFSISLYMVSRDAGNN